MNKKIAVICHSEHHIQKSLLLKKQFLSDVEIFTLKINSLKKIEHDTWVVINNNFVSNFDSFIFFTLHTKKVNIKLYELIRNQGKKIIAFQESNQLEMHNGDVNNLILSPDFIVSASNNEKIELVNNYYYKNQEIKSYGWLFNSDLYLKNNIPDKKLENILLILSAPDSITASSYETLKFRENLIEALAFFHKKEKILIKPHPLEDLSNINTIVHLFAKKNCKIEVLTKKEAFLDAINCSKTIYTSNRTQSCIDMIDTNKLVIYKLGPDNFISAHGLNYAKVFKKNQISFINFSSKKCIASFKNKYINSNQNNFSLIENSINDTSKITSKALIFKQEVSLWKYLYGMSHMKSLQDFLRENDLENEIKILEKPEEITEENFYILEKNFSIRSAFFLIYARGVLQKNITANKAIQAILKKNITRWFSQYYAIDAINLYYYLKIQNLEKAVIEKNSLELILNTIKIFQDRSISMRLFLYFQDFISRINSLLNVKIQFFWSLNLIWNIIRKIKSK